MTTLTRTRITVFLLLVVFVITVAVHYSILTNPFPGHNDFLTPWQASRSFFYDDLDPYGPETSLIIQEKIYGRAALPDEFPNHFAYPFYAMYVTWPLIHLDYSWATAIWMVLLETLLVGSLFLSFDLFNYQPRPLTAALIILFIIVSYPGGRGLILGQVSHLVVFLQILTIWALVKDQQGLAGVALAISTFKPQMGTLLVPFLLLWGFRTARWRFLWPFAIVFGGLVLSSFVLQPDWVQGMIDQVDLYPSYIEVSTPAWVFAQVMLDLGDAAEWVINITFYAFMLWTWYTVLVQNQQQRFLWVVMMTITVTHLVAFRTATPHFVIFMLPMVFYLAKFAEKYPWRTFGVLVTIFALTWAHFLFTIDAEAFEHPTNFIPIPLLAFVVLWFTRHMWWQFAPEPATESSPALQEAAT